MASKKRPIFSTPDVKEQESGLPALPPIDEDTPDLGAPRESMATIPDSCPTIATVEAAVDLHEVAESSGHIKAAKPLPNDTIPAPPIRDTVIDDLAEKRHKAARKRKKKR